MELQSHRGDRLGREEFLLFALLLRRRFPQWALAGESSRVVSSV